MPSILKFLYERLQSRENPREIGEWLKGNLRDFWRYRVGDYQVLCRLDDDIVTVYVVHVAHQREVYKK